MNVPHFLGGTRPKIYLKSRPHQKNDRRWRWSMLSGKYVSLPPHAIPFPFFYMGRTHSFFIGTKQIRQSAFYYELTKTLSRPIWFVHLSKLKWSYLCSFSWTIGANIRTVYHLSILVRKQQLVHSIQQHVSQETESKLFKDKQGQIITLVFLCRFYFVKLLSSCCGPRLVKRALYVVRGATKLMHEGLALGAERGRCSPGVSWGGSAFFPVSDWLALKTTHIEVEKLNLLFKLSSLLMRAVNLNGKAYGHCMKRHTQWVSFIFTFQLPIWVGYCNPRTL